MFRFTVALTISVAICLAQPDVQRQQAEQQVAAQLQQAPNNITLLLRLASMKTADAGSLRDKDARTTAFDEIQSYYDRVLSLDANNIPALHGLGVLGWMRISPDLRAARTQLQMSSSAPGPIPDRSVRAVLNSTHATTLNNSIGYLQRVLSSDPQSNDATAYLNLLYRCKADLEDTPEAAAGDIATADGFVQKTLEIARAKGGSATSFPPSAGMSGAAVPQGRIRVAGEAQAGNLIRKVDPIYPELAQRARIQGTVKFNAVIAKDGTMVNLQVMSGHPMLVQAALESVKTYLYKPTLLNGEPVEVMTTVDVDFVLP